VAVGAGAKEIPGTWEACDWVAGGKKRGEGYSRTDSPQGAEMERYRYDGIFQHRGLEDGQRRDENRIGAACRAPAQDSENGMPGAEGGEGTQREKGRQVTGHHSKPYRTAILQAS
jgi:hypothetical protein